MVTLLPRSNPVPEVGGGGKSNDQCPVCRSSRYLNRNMKFMVNPECYHRMCESCVDRLFHSGPRLCPIAGCDRTLRRQRFRVQRFEDIRVEREVDIRRGVAKVFNRREEEFDTLQDYNNYLNEVEDVVFNLINGVDVANTERRLRDYEAAHKTAILENESLAKQEADSIRAQEAVEHEQARMRRQLALKELEDERRARTAGKQQVINMLATGHTDAVLLKQQMKQQQQQQSSQASQSAKHAVLKRASAKRTLIVADDDEMTSGSAQTPDGFGPDPLSRLSAGITFAGLKKRAKAEPDKPFEPFGSSRLEAVWHQPQRNYVWDYLDRIRTEPAYVAAGANLEEYYSHAILDGFAGLSIMVEAEQGGAIAR